MAQAVEPSTLDFGSGHDLMVHGYEPRIGLSADTMQPAWDSLSPSLFLPLPCSLSFLKKKKKKGLYQEEDKRQPQIPGVS